MPGVSRFIPQHQEQRMATYGKKAGDKVEKAMHEKKRGTLKSGGSGKKVTSRKQAIAIGLSEARKEGGKVPAKKSAAKKSGGAAKKSAAKKSTGRKTAAKKTSARKTTAKKSTARKSTGAKKTAAKKGGARKSAAKKSAAKKKS
jgi:hypothetical protein